jgi:heptosyltransferase-2
MNLAMFLPNWIGDVVMATPAIRALRNHFAPTRCIAVCRPYVLGVLGGSPWFDDHVFLDTKGPLTHRWASAAWQLRKQHIDVAVLFPNSFRSALVAWLGGCKRRIGFDRDGRGGFLTDRLTSVIDASGKFVPAPVIDDYNRLAEAAGCARPGHRMELFTTAADESAADAVYDKFRISPRDEVICLNPGAAFGAAKFWPAEHFARLAQDLVATRCARILVLCGPDEREQARRIVKLADRTDVHSLAEETLSLGLTKALVKRCSLLVTTDSGPRHFAAAFDRPVVSLYGPTHIDWTRTFFDKEINVQKKVPCGPCQLRVCPTDHVCMTTLAPAEVFAAAQRLLAPLHRKAS